MRLNKSWFVFSACVLVPAAVVTACGDDDDGDHPTPFVLEAGGDVYIAPVVDAQTGEGGSEAGTPDAGDAGRDAGDAADAADAADASDADAGPKPTSVDDATYKITSWTCTSASHATVDVLAFADAANIAEIDLTVNNLAGQLDVTYKASTCKRTNAITIQYPQAGEIKTTSSLKDTCSGTCTTGQCDATKDQAILTDTDAFTTTSSSFTGTRSFPSGYDQTIQGSAGCKEGDTESTTYTKKP